MLLSGNANATKKALLVGVSEYPNLPDNLQLDGPVYDADMVYSVLRQRGFTQDNIQQLLTKPGFTSPTRQNILLALDSLVASAREGDFYYLHFAGHGSRQPAKATSNDEADGLDEIFLPTDASSWDDYIGSVKNAILDDEIASYIDRIRAKGADIWIVFDSCHSGTMTRGAAMPEVRYRRVDSSVLGIPDAVFNDINDNLESSNFALSNDEVKSRGSDQRLNQGQLIAFSAAQSIQSTPEMKLPRGEANRRYHGLFTYALMDVLSSNAHLSYQQLAQKILARYESIPWRNSQPLFSASDMNARVFGEEGSGVQQFVGHISGEELFVQGGYLAMLTTGSEIALFADPADTNDKKLASVILTDADAVTSNASLSNLDTAGWPKVVYARLIKSAVDFKLNISLQPSKSMTDNQTTVLQDQLMEIADEEPLLQLSDNKDADILVSEFEGHYWFLRADQTLPCEEQLLAKEDKLFCDKNRTPQLLLNAPMARTRERSVKLLRDSLLKIANVERLLASPGHLQGAQQNLEISFKIKRQGEVQDLPVNTRPQLEENDQILFDVQNIGHEPQDVSILFIDSQYGITQLYPEKGQPNRLQAGESLSFNWTVNVDTVGTEHILLSTQPGKGVNNSLAQLEQPPMQILSRGLGSTTPPSNGGIELFSWQVSR